MSRFWSSLTHDLRPYVPGEQPRMVELVKLNTNENPLGPSPACWKRSAVRRLIRCARAALPPYSAPFRHVHGRLSSKADSAPASPRSPPG
jgi:histidinol-phosphate/aromatic aminotransferase/cobyric acid decarboxylase-like protein